MLLISYFRVFQLKRHSTLLYLPMPGSQALKSIFAGTLEACLLFNERSNIDSDLSNAIVEASLQLLELVTQVLKPCPTPGRQHYLFNMKTITAILQVNLQFSLNLIYKKRKKCFLELSLKKGSKQIE